MREWLVAFTEFALPIIDGMALLIVLVGTLEAFVNAVRLTVTRPTDHRRQQVWLRFASWLVGALTFQLAADIIETSITTDWDALGRIAVIALIRTFLNYFLGRDVTEIRRREQEEAPSPPPPETPSALR